MNLGPTQISGTYRYVLNQSGANPITLGNNSAVDWNAGGVVALTGAQTINGAKTFGSTIIGAINGNAGSVTDGVYLTGAQTIGGLKTFSNGLISSVGITGTNLVYNTGDQSISGAKTFSSPIYLRLPNFTGSSSGPGNQGELRASGSFLYLATGSNLWGRVQLTSF
jgi:hypothetical protein